ncbi:MAG: BamA/TamA family outer membrane protein [Bacteroidota bacterium]
MLVSLTLCGQSTRIVVIGNAIDAVAENTGFLDAVKKATRPDTNTIILYAGNNARPYDTATLRKEADIVKQTGAKAYFIAGYRDWAHGKKGGYRAVAAQHDFLKRYGDKNVAMLPGDACVGPKKTELANDAWLVTMDSQWWLHDEDKPGMESGCGYRTKEQVVEELENVAKDKYDKLVIFASYHPMKNTGVHSGTFGLKQHLFPLTDIRRLSKLYLPLPLIGSLYPMVRNALVSKQDMNSRAYREMTESGVGTLAGTRKVFDGHPHTLFIGGQERSIQILKDGQHHYIISGATSNKKRGRVRHTRETLYATNAPGFVVIELSAGKKVSAVVYKVTGDSAYVVRREHLMDYSETPMEADTAKMPMVTTDSTMAIASTTLATATKMDRFLNGENYRKEWGLPVKMKVFRIGETPYKITGLGGGHESKTLQMEDSEGKKWVLRPVKKNPEHVIPEGYRQTIASDMVVDMSSGQHPYGAMVVPDLAAALRVVYSTPVAVFVANDTALGKVKPLFANKVAQLERRKPGVNDIETMSTQEAMNEMLSGKNGKSDQKMFLKVRLLDFLIADFDRHNRQYNWGIYDTAGDATIFYPVAKDRDQSLYNNDGFLISMARQRGYAFMVNFTERIKKMREQGIVGLHMDMFFLNELGVSDWNAILADFKNSLPDTLIARAVNRLPREAYDMRGAKITSTLIKRRDILAARGMEYYKYISKEVNITGSNNADLFTITSSDSGIVARVYQKTAAGMQLNYSRTFDPSVTKEIRLWGFNGNDEFNVAENVQSKIKIRVIGGKGSDTFDIRGRLSTYIYDVGAEQNIVKEDRHTIKMFSQSPRANAYEFKENIGNSFQFPAITAAFNQDGGLLAGVGATYKSHGFRKYPYGSMQQLYALWSITHEAFQLRYTGEFIDVYRHYDLSAKAGLLHPSLNYFFGLGNETIRDKSKPIAYYGTRYDLAYADVLAKKRLLNNAISLGAGPSFQYYNYLPGKNNARILQTPEVAGLDSAGVNATKLYGGGKVAFAINNIDDNWLPEQGIRWTTELTALRPISTAAQPYTAITSHMDLYATLSERAKLVSTLHVGGGHILSGQYEYFQAMTLGGNNYLRGYRRNRFAGSSVFYADIEMRVRLLRFNTYVMKGDLGLIGFNDIGRVWVKNERSNKWHHGYGGGLYITPFNTILLSALIGLSEEDQLLNVSLGAGLNIAF